MGRLDKTKFKDMISKVHSKPKHITRESQIPSHFNVVDWDTGGPEMRKIRKRNWKKIKRKEKIKQAKLRKLSKLLKKKKKQEAKMTKKQVKEIFLKADWLLKQYCTQTAYNFLEFLRVNEPNTYKRIFSIIIEPQILGNIEKYVNMTWRYIRKKGGLSKDKKIKHTMILKYYRQITGRKPNISIKRKGMDIDLKDVL